jgi:hypothetical protein
MDRFEDRLACCATFWRLPVTERDPDPGLTLNQPTACTKVSPEVRGGDFIFWFWFCQRRVGRGVGSKTVVKPLAAMECGGLSTGGPVAALAAPICGARTNDRGHMVGGGDRGAPPMDNPRTNYPHVIRSCETSRGFPTGLPLRLRAASTTRVTNCHRPHKVPFQEFDQS